MMCKPLILAVLCLCCALLAANTAQALPVSFQLVAEYRTGDLEDINNIWYDPVTQGRIVHHRGTGTRLGVQSLDGTTGSTILNSPQVFPGLTIHPTNGNLLSGQFDDMGTLRILEFDRSGNPVPGGIDIPLAISGPTSPEYDPDGLYRAFTINPFNNDVYVIYELEIQKFNSAGELLDAWNPGNREIPAPDRFLRFAYNPNHDVIFLDHDGIGELYDGTGHFLGKLEPALGANISIVTFSFDPANDHLYIWTGSHSLLAFQVVPEPFTMLTFPIALAALVRCRRERRLLR